MAITLKINVNRRNIVHRSRNADYTAPSQAFSSHRAAVYNAVQAPRKGDQAFMQGEQQTAPLHRFYPIVKRIVDGRCHIIFPQAIATWRSPRGYVENVAAAIVLAATDNRAAGRIYNCVSNRYSVNWNGRKRSGSRCIGVVNSFFCPQNARLPT